MSRPDPNPAVDFVRVPTPDSWLASALQQVLGFKVSGLNLAQRVRYSSEKRCSFASPHQTSWRECAESDGTVFGSIS